MNTDKRQAAIPSDDEVIDAGGATVDQFLATSAELDRRIAQVDALQAKIDSGRLVALCPECGESDTSPHKQGAVTAGGKLVTITRRQCHNPTCCHRWTSER